ncbi:MAG: radical SAM protein [Desulfomonilaceae bacterium]
MTEHRHRAIFHDLVPLHGFHGTEADIRGPFVWSKKRFAVRKTGAGANYVARFCFNGDETALNIMVNGSVGNSITIRRGWNNYPLDFSDVGAADIEFEISYVPHVPGDSRELGIMIRSIRKLESPQAVNMIGDSLRNKFLNDLEFADGRIVLESLPQQLRIAFDARCNIKPHCVYCDWEEDKPEETATIFRLSCERLSEMGSFFSLAESVGECIWGEPLLNSNFSEVVSHLHRCGKSLAVATNGLLLNIRNRSLLLGKDVELYISLDSSTPEGYARYRNNKFDQVIGNVRALCAARPLGTLPNVIATFIAIKSNIDEFSAFVDLMKDIGVDGIRVTYLNTYPHLMNRVVRRGHSEFRYGEECMSPEKFDLFLNVARKAAAARGMPLLPSSDFMAADAHVNGPLCNEPWKSINAAGSGLALCTFNHKGMVARWSEQGNRSTEQFLFDVWNGEVYREIRSELAHGRFARQCVPWCPIVRRTPEKIWERSRR